MKDNKVEGEEGSSGIDEPEEIQKRKALNEPGKPWRQWFYEDFLRYSFWTLVLFEAIFAISVISYITGINQLNAYLITGTVVSFLALNYFLVYRRVWRKHRKKSEGPEHPSSLFDRIK
ncbi:MAG: hypothetical protein KIY12_05050 [Thermoplasmata archaeon]|uniref:Uncharacterized protein n=1 Tax=Candidatus Sysuiplasma superficiale TaxID=2823368 RepID=A0A8J7YX99_9ARCH|nr:hypothetical protein [Candidatus Sysuiplasma superficiale]MBX8644076.1 hypothetical protein [Candidatus Sysuiplasma superficiale]MCL4346314.1 hypothetical protein [Candidatus Thermoplasmatota archaeon]